MAAEGSGKLASPRSDLSESQLWEVIVAESTSGDAHLLAPAGELTIAYQEFCLSLQEPGMTLKKVQVVGLPP